MSNLRRDIWVKALLLLVALEAGTQEFDAEARRMLRDALYLSPEYTEPVLTDSGDPLAVVSDFNGDGAPDIAILTIAADRRVVASEESLSSRERMFDSQAIRPLFLLETLFQLSDSIVTVELGRQVVLSDLALLSLSARENDAVRISFRSRSGTTDNLVTFSRDGRAHRLRLVSSQSEFGELTDVDGDGTLDAVVARRVPEAGRGYETFLELYQLRSGAYARVAGFGLVRELTAFVEKARTRALGSRWKELADMIEPSAAGEQQGEPTAGDAFRLVEANNEEPGAESGGPVYDVTDIVVLQFTDNPFSLPFRGQTIQLAVRVECCGGAIRVYTGLIQLNENPFEETKFTFLTAPESER